MSEIDNTIRYKDIMDLGFTESVESDSTYFDTHGFNWCIINLHLTKNKMIYLDWEKENQLCSMYRTDKDHNIIRRLPIQGLEHLKIMVDFFLGKL